MTLLSLLVGVPAALALEKGEFRGREALHGFFLAPLLLPTLITGLALAAVLHAAAADGDASRPRARPHDGDGAVRHPHDVDGALRPCRTNVEAAAATLGAPPWRVVWRVTLPLAAPGLIACSALSFLLSFDETVISLFVSGPRASTLPVEMVRYVEGRTDPMIAALSVVAHCRHARHRHRRRTPGRRQRARSANLKKTEKPDA